MTVNSFDGSRFGKSILFLFSMPVLYMGAILAVSVHEIIGHGLTAQLLGGTFKGFGIALDGMGWADIDAKGFTDIRLVIMYLGGAVCTTVYGLAFFSAGLLFRGKDPVRFVFFCLGFCFMLDGIPYYFWDALFLGGIGDFSMIYNLFPGMIMRAMTILLCGLLMTGTIVLFTVEYYRIAARFLGNDTRTNTKNIIAYSVILYLQQTLYWFAFDWNQLVYGVGILPALIGITISFITLCVLFYLRPMVKENKSHGKWQNLKTMIISIWAVCTAMILCIVFYLQNGVSFSR